MKVLCLGNNSEDTVNKTVLLSQEYNLPYHGLVNQSNKDVSKPGFYHTNILDLSNAEITSITQQCDKVVILDQPRESYSHPNIFLNTVALAQQLNSEWQNPDMHKHIGYWQQLVDKNKSFCIFPFIELLTENGHTKVCCRSTKTIKHLSQINDWATDPEYLTLRNKLISGDKIPEHCGHCYREESLGIISARQQETVEWANRLNLKTTDDLASITNPSYYEVRASNTCNLQCRTCSPEYSHLIEQEYQRIGLPFKSPPEYFSNFDFVDLKNIEKIYISGGEPTAQVEFFDFLDRCIADQTTDFEVMINTNANKFSKKFLSQIDQFSNLQFIVSVDGFDSLNYYIRWPSDWHSTVENIKAIIKRHQVTVNSVLSIYNIVGYADLLEYVELEFPTARVHAQIAVSKNNRLSPLNHPNADLVISNLARIKNLKCYHNDSMLASVVDSVINHYRNNFAIDMDCLRQFFEFNDLLDHSRNVKLADYIPELEQYRSLL